MHLLRLTTPGQPPSGRRSRSTCSPTTRTSMATPLRSRASSIRRARDRRGRPDPVHGAPLPPPGSRDASRVHVRGERRPGWERSRASDGGARGGSHGSDRRRRSGCGHIDGNVGRIDVTANDAGLTDETEVVLDEPPSSGEAQVKGRVVTYVPAAGFVGTDRFTYRLVTGDTMSDPATITVRVQPVVSIGDVSVDEPSEVAVEGVIEVTLSGPSPDTVTMAFAAVGITASEGSDFGAASGVVTSRPGQTVATVVVQILADGDLEDEGSSRCGVRRDEGRGRSRRGRRHVDDPGPQGRPQGQAQAQARARARAQAQAQTHTRPTPCRSCPEGHDAHGAIRAGTPCWRSTPGARGGTPVAMADGAALSSRS